MNLGAVRYGGLRDTEWVGNGAERETGLGFGVRVTGLPKMSPWFPRALARNTGFLGSAQNVCDHDKMSFRPRSTYAGKIQKKRGSVFLKTGSKEKPDHADGLK
jgi:hypothetical protein